MLFVFSANATVVSRAEAESLAKKHFGNVSNVTCVWGDNQTKASAEAPAYYVFNNPNGGWVIISGEDATCPVLGYSNTGSFKAEGMPSNVSNWFKRLGKDINTARKNNVKASSSILAKWHMVGVRTKASTGKLLQTAEWDQLAPYNDSCKVACNGDDVCTGCVATAMAIVIRYNQWPARGNGIAPSYKTDTENYSIPARNLNHDYNYTNMPLTDGYSNGWTAAQKKAVAQLMYDCGAMVKMDYSEDGSGAWSSDIAPALTTYMSYANTAREVVRAVYSNNEWFNMLKDEIDADCPVIYGGSDDANESGHQFVVDGYDEYDNVHINWGWGGYDNGYFPVCYLEGQGYVFSDYDSAILGLRKGTAQTASSTSAEIFLNDYPVVASGTVAKGSSFTFSSLTFVNTSYYTAYNGVVKAALCDVNGNVKEYIGQKNLSVAKTDDDDYSYPSASISSFSCSITEDIALGDKIRFYYQLADNSWAFAGISASANSYSFIQVADSYKAGQTYYFELVPQMKDINSISWYYDGSSYSKEYVILTAGTHTVKAVVKYSDNTTETIVQKVSAN